MTRVSRDILTEPPPTDADARIVYGPEPLQFGDLRLPRGPGPHPLAVVVHGGYWQAIYNLTHAGHLCVDLAEHGIATWNVEYRRIGDPGGGWPNTLDDVTNALQHVRQLGETYALDTERVVLVGHSAGGQLALLAATRSQLAVQGVVSLAGVVDPVETARCGLDNGLIARFTGADNPDSDAWEAASPRAQLPLGFPYVLACGTADPLWPTNDAFAKAAHAAGDDIELVPLQGAGHFEVVDPKAAEWSRVRSEIMRLLS